MLYLKIASIISIFNIAFIFSENNVYMIQNISNKSKYFISQNEIFHISYDII